MQRNIAEFKAIAAVRLIGGRGLRDYDLSADSLHPRRKATMSKLAWIVALAALSTPAAAQQAGFPDLRGTWKGESESIVLGGTGHHPAPQTSAQPRYSSVPFTMVIDKQDGRRFSGTFSSPRQTETIIAVIGRNGTIYMVDDDGYNLGTVLSPNRIDLCYMHLSAAARIASCTELTKQP
jgi:hypothetical protein